MKEKTNGTDLLLTGMSNNASLLSDDELGEIFGGYLTCPSGYCCEEYEFAGLKCKKDYCVSDYVN